MKAYPFFLLLLLPISLFASDWTLEIRGAYFNPSSKPVRDCYSSGLLDYEVEAAKRISDFVEVWTGVNWMSKRGHHSDNYWGFKEKTRIQILPVSIGFKFIYPVTCCLDAYLGAGVCYSFLTIKNEWEYSGYGSSSCSSLKRITHKNGVGAVIKTGIQYAMGPTTFIDVFADYFSQQFDSSKGNLMTNSILEHKLNCSGFKFGAGFGVYF